MHFSEKLENLEILKTFFVSLPNCLITGRKVWQQTSCYCCGHCVVTQFVTKKIGNFTAQVSEALQMVPEVTPIVVGARNHEYTPSPDGCIVCTIPPTVSVTANLNDWSD